jgi:hypothetical protein
MKVSVEVPLYGDVSSSRMFGSKWTIASEAKEYDIPQLPGVEGSLVLSLRPSENDDPVDFHLVDGQSYRDVGTAPMEGGVFILSVGRDTRAVHPFFERAFAAMSAKLRELGKLGKTDLKEKTLPDGLVDALHLGGSLTYAPTPAKGSRYEWWKEKEIEHQREEFDAWIARFAVVGERLMVREDVPMLMVGGDPEFPALEVVWGDGVRDPVSMNTSIGFMPKTFGYFGFDEFEAAVGFAAEIGGGWLSDPEVRLEKVSPLVTSRPYADLTLIDVAEGMRKRFVRRIASVSHDPVESFTEMEEALGSISVETFALFKELVDGIAEWSSNRSSRRIVAVLPAILGDANARKVFFVTERLACIADLALRRWDDRPMDVAALAA